MSFKEQLQEYNQIKKDIDESESFIYELKEIINFSSLESDITSKVNLIIYGNCEDEEEQHELSSRVLARLIPRMITMCEKDIDKLKKELKTIEEEK